MPITLPHVLLSLRPSAIDLRAAVEALAASLPAASLIVQLDAENQVTRKQLSWVKHLVSSVRAKRNWVVVRDRVDIALAARTDGVVLPADGFDVFTARSLAGSPRFLVGVEAPDADGAGAASRDGANFIVTSAGLADDTSRAGPLATVVRAASEAGDARVFAASADAGASAAAAKALGAHGVLLNLEDIDPEQISDRCQAIASHWLRN